MRVTTEFVTVTVEALDQDDAEGLVEDDIDSYVNAQFMPHLVKRDFGEWEIENP